MNDTFPAGSTPPGPVPPDDPERVLTHMSPDSDEPLDDAATAAFIAKAVALAPKYHTELLLDGPTPDR